jgi:hypothetical protein
MTLLITLAAAVLVTILRFAKPGVGARFHLGFLALMYWGASLMWSVDGIANLLGGESFIEISDRAAMSDDALLGVCVVALGIVVWLVYSQIVKHRVSAQKRA